MKAKRYRPPSDEGVAAAILAGGCLFALLWYGLIIAAIVTAIVLAWRNFG